jgi:hypothetical protein
MPNSNLSKSKKNSALTKPKIKNKPSFLMREKEFISKEKKFLLREEKFLLKEERVLLKDEKIIIKDVYKILNSKFFFKFKYPKLFLFLVCIILAYFFSLNVEFGNFFSNLGSWSYLGAFIAGLTFSFGFTSPFSAAIFLLLNPSNIFIAAIIGGLGAALGDFIIFKFIRIYFDKEFSKLKKEHVFILLKLSVRKEIPHKLWHFFLFALGGIFFALPVLPNELAVALFAGFSKMDAKEVALISFVFSALGIFLLLLV